MKRETKKTICMAITLLTAFVLWTAALCIIDRQVIGPQGTTVGFATLNRWFHQLTGVHMVLYDLTDGISILPLGLAAGFGLLGLRQWVERKQIRKVDRSLLVLGSFYVLVLAAFLFFERVIVNYRPILITGQLEASYPSSTTMLAICVLSTAAMQLQDRLVRPVLRRWGVAGLHGLAFFMVIGRLLSGVHWLSDIVGGVLLSGGLVLLYAGISRN